MKKTTLLYAFLLFSALYVKAQGLVISEMMYNFPGEDTEFLEFYNNSTEVLDLEGYEITEGISFIFPAITLAPQTTLVLTNDSRKHQAIYFDDALEWESGSLANGGEQIVVINAVGDTIIDFEYSDNLPWSQMADGGGASLEACDFDGDFSDPSNWTRSVNVVGIEEGVPVFASPDRISFISNCMREPIISASFRDMYVRESDEMAVVEFFMDNAPSGDLRYVASVVNSPDPKATVDVDYILSTDSLSFAPESNSSQTLTIELIDDTEAEPLENLIVTIFPLVSGGPLLDDGVTVFIIDNDGPLQQGIQLRGILESPAVKAIELFVSEDLTSEQAARYDLSSANNGSGGDGLEHFLNQDIPGGNCIFVTNDTIAFRAFFGPTNNSFLIQDEEEDVSFNGDDAIELFENGQLIDVFGIQDVDGTGEAWEYSDGWAKRTDDAPSLSTTFNEADWTFSGVDGLNGDTNEGSFSPYDLSCMTSSVVDVEGLTVLVYPNPTTGAIIIESEELIDNISVFDFMGRAVQVPGQGKTLDLSRQQSGIYLIRFQIGEKKGTARVVKM